jgi:TRAP-type C4-dicarboxylate transport system substrate-binding protein
LFKLIMAAGVAFEDLSKEDQRRIKEEMRRELEEVEAAKKKENLACYQKMRGGVVQKGDTSKASSSKVNSSSLTPKN